jgi:hypothetical protein
VCAPTAVTMCSDCLQGAGQDYQQEAQGTTGDGLHVPLLSAHSRTGCPTSASSCMRYRCAALAQPNRLLLEDQS